MDGNELLKLISVTPSATDFLRHSGVAAAKSQVARGLAPVRCLIPQCDGTYDHHAERDALWARFFTEAPPRLSGCVGVQAFIGCHGVLSRTMALRVVSSFRMTATRATFFGRPREVSRS